VENSAPLCETEFVPALARGGGAESRLTLTLSLSGERIVSSRLESGFCHRGAEKLFERRAWRQCALLAERLDPFSPAHHALCWSLAAERLAGFTPVKRARVTRVGVCELERIASHLAFFYRLAQAIGYDGLSACALRDRELALSLFELLCGSRAAFGAVRPFENGAEPGEEFLDRANEFCDYLEARLSEYASLTVSNPSFAACARGAGRIGLQTAAACSLSGPNLRACGAASDLRKSSPYCGYEEYEFQTATGADGCALARVRVRLEEMAQSSSLLRACLEKLEFPQKYGLDSAQSSGPGGAADGQPEGEVYACVESPRGRLSCYIRSDGGKHPARVHFRAPSFFAQGALAPALKNAQSVFEAALITASLDISSPEADR